MGNFKGKVKNRIFCLLCGFFAMIAFGQVQAEVEPINDHIEHIEGIDPNDQSLGPVISDYEFFNEADDFLARGVRNTYLSVRYDRLVGFTSSIREKLSRAKKLLERVLNSPEFYKAVRNHTYNGKVHFVDNNGYDNEEIYELIQAGREKFSKTIDYIMNLELELYYENSNTVGYTYINSPMIYVNRKFYDRYTPAQIGRNLLHEWLHNLGFNHDKNYTVRRNYSVPYGVADIFQRLAK